MFHHRFANATRVFLFCVKYYYLVEVGEHGGKSKQTNTHILYLV